MEFGDVQASGIEQAHIQCPIGGIVAPVADELVEVLETLVIAAVDDHLTARSKGDGGPFVLEPAERRALYGPRLWVVGVDLDNPAETQRFVGLLADVEAVMVPSPAIPVS
jgi:hypothetical protein